MSSKKTLRQILDASDKCFLVPCVYDCASNHAVEMCGFPVSLLSGGEVSISRNGVIDYGFTNLTDLEEVISRTASAALWLFTALPSAWPLPVPLLFSWKTPLTWRSPPRSCPATSTWPRFALLSKRWMAPTAC